MSEGQKVPDLQNVSAVGLAVPWRGGEGCQETCQASCMGSRQVDLVIRMPVVLGPFVRDALVHRETSRLMPGLSFPSRGQGLWG